MSDEVLRIRRMVAEGKVTPEEGRELIESVTERPPASAVPPEPPPASMPPAHLRPSWVVWPLVSHGIIFAATLVMLVVVVPRFKEIWKSFDVELPKIIVLILSLSALVKTYFVLLAPLAGALLAADTAIYALLRRRGSPGAATLWWWGVALLGLLAFAFLCLGIFLPQVALMNAVGRQ